MTTNASAFRAAPMQLPPITQATLENGLQVVTVEKRDLPLVSMRLVMPTGSARDPKGKEGLASFAAELARRGTKSRTADQIDDEIESMGGLLGIGAEAESTSIVVTVPAEQVESALAVVANLARHASFPKEEVELGRRRRLAGLQQELDDPSNVADRALVEYFYGENHPFGHPGDGRAASVKTLTRDDLVKFRDATWTPHGGMLLFVGDLAADEAMRLAKNVFGDWRGPKLDEVKLPSATPTDGLDVLVVDKPDASQAQVRLAVPGIRRGDARYYAAALSNTVVGGGFTSRLVDEVRVNRGLSYSVSTRVSARRELGSVTLQTFTKNETVRDIVDVSLAVLDAFRASGPTEDELEKARRFAIGLYPLRVESNEQLAEALAGAWLVGQPFDVVARHRDELAQVTLAQAIEAAKLFPGSAGAKIVVVGKASEIQPRLAGLGKLTVRPVQAFE